MSGTPAVKGYIYLDRYLGVDMHFLNYKIHLGYRKHKLGYCRSVTIHIKILQSSLIDSSLKPSNHPIQILLVFA